MVAPFRAVKKNWQESPDEADEDKQNLEKEKEGDPEDVFHPQDAVPEQELEVKDSDEKTEDKETIQAKEVRFKGLRSASSSKRRPVLTERGEEEDDWFGPDLFDEDAP